MNKGILIVIDGTDGSGKTVQLHKLIRRIHKFGRKVKIFDFPQYKEKSSYFVQQYLSGKYGSVEEVGPYCASMFYAMDRFDVCAQIKEYLQAGFVVVSNRYVSANMGHQGSKIKSAVSRKKYFRWLDELEYKILKIPRPDVTIILHVSPEKSQELVDKKGPRPYSHGKKRDIHEASIQHLRNAERTYLSMPGAFPGKFKLIECMNANEIMPANIIADKVWQIVEPMLK